MALNVCINGNFQNYKYVSKMLDFTVTLLSNVAKGLSSETVYNKGRPS